MKNARSYFDYNATAPLRPEARAAMIAAFDEIGNASSVHAEGRRARAIVEEAREQVADLVGANASEIVFTAGATEANNWVISANWETIITSQIEHESILAPASVGAADLIDVGADASGVTDVGAIGAALLCRDLTPERTLVSLQLANNETGVVQPLGEVCHFARQQGAFVHSDATQAIGRIPVSFADLGLHYLSMSGHKIGGPKGVGVLVVRDGLELPALIKGGGQERRRRAGTENVAAIVGLGAAAQATRRDLNQIETIRQLRDRLEAGVRKITPEVVFIGDDVERLANTSCLAVAGEDSKSLVIKLDLAGIAVGAGSACSSGKVGGSHVMLAMGIDSAIGEAAIRISLGVGTSESDIDAFLSAWERIHSGTPQWSISNFDDAARQPVAHITGER